jgi:arabinoxylan arabinofuranohydrolase
MGKYNRRQFLKAGLGVTTALCATNAPASPRPAAARAEPRAAVTSGGFLFVTFKGETTPLTEQVYFGLSRDGRRWEALNGAEPVLVSRLGEKGVRDPFILRSHDGKRFYLLATDLSIHLNKDWKRAVRGGSRSIVVWESADLVRWSEPRMVRVAAADAGCTWAPEAVYDGAKRDYLVFWASTNAGDDFAKQRIWASRTRDFRSFGKPFVYVDKPHQVIDTTIVHEGGKYYRFSKDEKLKAITLEVGGNLMGPWRDVAGFSLATLQGYEGPQCFLLEPAAPGRPPTWCLLLDHYRERAGYKPFLSRDLSSGKFAPAAGFEFPFRFRHGSVLPLTAGEYARLKAAYGNPHDSGTEGRP